MGEGTRCLLWWHLLVHTAYVWLTMALLYWSIDDSLVGIAYVRANFWLIVSMIVNMLVCVVVTVYFGLMTLLALKNLTLAEVLDATEIDYMQHGRWTSPFSKGLVKNLAYFCSSAWAKNYTEWQVESQPEPLQ